MQRKWQVLLATSVAVFMSFLDVTIVNIAFPDIRASFGDTSLAGLSWVLNAYNIVFAALLVPAGRLADRVGRRRLFFAGLWTFLAASVACGLAPSAEVLVVARVVQAAGAAALVPTSLALLLPEFPLEQRATATAIWGATGAVAAATGPSLGGVLVDATGWRLVFFVNLAFGLAALVPARRLPARDPRARPRPAARRARRRPADRRRRARVAGDRQGARAGAGADPKCSAHSPAAWCSSLCALRSARHPAPVVELSLFRVRSFAVASGGVALFALGFYALLLGNVLFLTQVWGWSILTAGFALTPGPLTAAITAPIGGAISDRFGQRVVAVPGGLLFAAGCLLFAANTGSEPAYVAEFLPATLLTGAGVGLSFAAWGSAAVAELPPARYATGSAVAACARQIGAVLGIAVLIAVVGTPTPADALDTFHRAWTLMAIPATAAGLTALALGRVHARDPEAVAAPAPA